MQSKLKTFRAHSLLFTWLISCLILFVYISRVDFVHIVTLPNWGALINVLTRIWPLGDSLDLLRALLGVLLFSLACLSLGLGILQKWVQPQSSKLALGITALLVGEILFSVIFLTLISLYRLTPALVVITLLLGFFLGFPGFMAFIKSLPQPSALSGFERSERIILILGVIEMILGLLLSATRLGYDATAEYFSHAKIMAVSHLPILFYPTDSFVVSSLHPGILFTAIIELFGDQSARLLSWVNGMAVLFLGLALGKELGLSPRARLWFLTLMVTSTAFVDLLGDGKIELISTAPALAAVYWMVRSTEQPKKGVFVLIGLLSGFAIIARPYNIFLVSLFIALFFIQQAFVQYRAGRFDLKQFSQSVLWIMPPLLALGVFHLFQNWIWLKSAIAPLTYARGLKSSDWQWQLDPAGLMLYRLLYPLTVTFLNSLQSLGNISPLFVGFLPFLLAKRVRENLHFSTLLVQFTPVALLTLLMWIIFFFTVLEIRYVLFLWIILFLAMAQVLESATHHVDVLIRFLVRVVLIIFMVVMCVRTLMIAVITYFPLNNAGNYYCPDSHLCTMLETLNKSAAPGDRVLVLHAYRYYLRPDLFACSSQMDEYTALEPLARQNSEEFWVEAYRRGFQFIIFEQHLAQDRYHFGKLPNLDTAPDWIQIETLYSSPKANQIIYKLRAVQPPIFPEISCRQDSMGLWEQYSSGASAQP